MAYLYTKGGDKGETGLFGGSRVPKDSRRVACYGAVDEANAALGMAYAECLNAGIRADIQGIQRALFMVGAELASDDNGLGKLSETVSEADITGLERLIDRLTEASGKVTGFVTPGATKASAALHVARTVIRRAEREVVRLSGEERVRPVLLKYVNRLSDAFFALARFEEHEYEYNKLYSEVAKAVTEKLNEMGLGVLPALSLENLLKIAERAKAKAAEIRVPIVFAAVDAGGNLILLERMEGSLLASIDIAINKAYTANGLKIATHELAKLTQPGGELFGIDATNQGRIVIFGGGYPYRVDGQVVGGVGVSGGTVAEDMEILGFALGVGL